MIGNDTQCARCIINTTLPFDALSQKLKMQLEMNGMSRVITITRENDRMFKLTYHNYHLGGVKHTFRLVCSQVNIAEAQRRGEPIAKCPEVEMKWSDC